MTPADEATCIALWTEGLETAAIAESLGIKATTAQSRAHRLQQRGLIDPRPRGGNCPTQRQREREEGMERVPGQTPGVSHHTPGVSKRVSDPVPVEELPAVPPAVNSPDITPLLQEILQELRTLTHGLAERVSPSAPPMSNRVSEGVYWGASRPP
jgi:DNA-binding transcriptional MocR family regulator